MTVPTQFRYARSWKVIAVFGIFMSLVVSLSAFLFYPNDLTELGFTISLVVGVIFTLSSMLLWKEVNVCISINKAGIHYVSRRKSRTVAWERIGEVKADDVSQRLEIFDIHGDKVMHIAYHLENFEVLRNLIVRNTIHVLRENQANVTTFRQSTAIYISIMLIMAAILGPGIAVGTLLENSASVVIPLVSFFAVLVGLYVLSVPKKLHIGSDHLVVHYGLWRKVVPFSEITDVYWRNVVTDQYGNIDVPIYIEYAGGKKIQISKFREGSLAIMVALNAALGPARAARRASDEKEL